MREPGAGRDKNGAREMAKRLQTAIKVTLQPDGRAPAHFWRGRTAYRVHRVEAIWKETGAWWEGEEERIYFRVLAGPENASARQAGFYHLCCRPGQATWSLTEILD